MKYIITGMVFLAAAAAQATVIAGWDWSLNANANYKAAGVTASQAWGGETNGVAVNLWNHEFGREDNDGTFGSVAPLDGTDIARSWKLGTPSGLTSSVHYLEYTIANGGTASYELGYFAFDALRVNSSPDTYVLSMTGDLGTDANIASGTMPLVGLPRGASDYPDYDISLAGLANTTLGAGQSVVFRLEFTDTNPNLGSNLYVDNVALVSIPEPATLGLVGMVGLGLLAARRFMMI